LNDLGDDLEKKLEQQEYYITLGDSCWVRTIGFKLTNARSETVREKPSFRDAFKNRRCLIPVDGFFEWRTEEKKKFPYLFQFKDERVFYLAGIWET